MHFSFYFLALLTAILFLLLALIWIFAPVRFLTAWGVSFSGSIELVGRRAGALYLGIATMFFIARNAEQSIARDGLVYGLITTCLLLGLLGLYEFFKGRAKRGILAAACIEMVLSLLFLMAI